MDSKNTIAAIALSSAVIVLYSLFFVPEKPVTNQNLTEKEKIEQSSDTPSLEQEKNIIQLSREDALNESDRIEFENNNVIGTISLKGAAIDDLTFKDYDTTLESNKKVTLLGPRNAENGYLIESGFVTSDKNIDIPDSETLWSVNGSKKLTDLSSIKLTWKNQQGLIFEKEISLDDEYLFTIKQKVINTTDKNLIKLAFEYVHDEPCAIVPTVLAIHSFIRLSCSILRFNYFVFTKLIHGRELHAHEKCHHRA